MTWFFLLKVIFLLPKVIWKVTQNPATQPYLESCPAVGQARLRRGRRRRPLDCEAQPFREDVSGHLKRVLQGPLTLVRLFKGFKGPLHW